MVNQMELSMLPSWRPLRWLLSVAWTVFLCIVLLQPESDPVISLGLPSGPQTLAREAFFTTLHVLAFALTCTLWYWTWRGHAAFRKSLALACIMAFAFGSGDGIPASFRARSPSLFY